MYKQIASQAGLGLPDSTTDVTDSKTKGNPMKLALESLYDALDKTKGDRNHVRQPNILYKSRFEIHRGFRATELALDKIKPSIKMQI